MSLDGGHIAAIGGWVIALLTLIGGGIKWAVGTRDSRAKMIDEAVERHVAGLNARLAKAEESADRAITRANRADERSAKTESEKAQVILILNQVIFAFQLLAADTQRRDPESLILKQARTVFDQARMLLRGTFPVPRNLPDDQQDLMDEIHERTKP